MCSGIKGDQGARHRSTDFDSTVQRSVLIVVDACIAWNSSQQTGECLRARSQHFARPDLAAWDC